MKRLICVQLLILLTVTLPIVGCDSADFAGQSRNGAEAKENDLKKNTNDGLDDGDVVLEENNDDSDGSFENDGSDDNDDENGGEGNSDDGTESGSDFADQLDNFINSDDKLRIEDGQVILEAFAPTETGAAVDIVIIVDTSFSMEDEIKKTENNLRNILSNLDQDPKSKNHQVFLLAGFNRHRFTPPAIAVSNVKFDFEVGTTSHIIGSHNSLAVARDFFKGVIKTPVLKLRSGVPKHLVFITDDDAWQEWSGIYPSTMYEAEFRTFLETDHGNDQITIHTISCPVKDSNCDQKSVAYRNLANEPKYKGTIQDLRLDNWGPVFSQVIDSLQGDLNLKFKLSKPLTDPDFVSAYINGKQISSAKFKIDKSANTIEILSENVGDNDRIVFVYK